MKETKKFFNNNRLNRGYSKTSNVKQGDAHMIRKKYQHVLPPIDIMEQYEDLNPGTLEKLFRMATKEQNHRHSTDLLVIEKNISAMRLGRMSALMFIVIVSVATLMLALTENIALAFVFAISAFTCITIVSYLYSRNSTHNRSMNNKYNNKQHNNKQRSYKNSRSYYQNSR